uniref:Uncharacterized protein n=1 Tax=Sexangularia sp. CB-2014 TaxID=1486929 RepID=A0A7S1VRZ8_9EUKA
MNVDREEAERLLSGRPPHSFIIRPSSKAECISVSYTPEDGSAIIHALVDCDASGKYRIDGSDGSFDSLNDLLAAHYLMASSAPADAKLSRATSSPSPPPTGSTSPVLTSRFLVRVSYTPPGSVHGMTKGMLLDPESSVQDAIDLCLAKFKITPQPDEQFMLYVPAPVNSWLKRSAQIGRYKFLANVEVELQSARATEPEMVWSGSGRSQRPPSSIVSAMKRTTQTLDLVGGKPVILKIVKYANDTIGASGEAVTRKMIFSSDDPLPSVLSRVLERFEVDAASASQYGLFAPPPFSLMLQEFEKLSHYPFLNQHNDVVLRKKTNEVLLKVAYDSGDIVRSLKVPVDATVREIIARLTAKTPVANYEDYGIKGKEPDKTVWVWMPDDAPISSFVTINLQNLQFARRDEESRKLRRQSKLINQGLAARPDQVLGTPPELLEQADDNGTMVPVCLSRIRDRLVECGGLDESGIFVRGTVDDETAERVFDDIKHDRTLEQHSPQALASAILLFYKRLPKPIFQPLEEKLHKAATSYEASMLLAAQLPQQHGLLLAWIMVLFVEVCLNSSMNGVSVAECGNVVGPLLVNSDDSVVTKLRRIAAVILQDKLDERVELDEMMAMQNDENFFEPVSEQYYYTQQSDGSAEPLPPSSDSVADEYSTVSSWTVEDVAAFVEMSGLADPSLFVSEDIDGESLMLLDDESLQRLGVTKLGPRKKLMKLISELKQG